MTRRESFSALFGAAPAISRPERKNKRAHHVHMERIYHGWIELPPEIVRRAFQSPLYRTTDRHEVIRLKHWQTTWIFREIVAGSKYLGEVIRDENGRIRVHLFRHLPPEANCKLVLTEDYIRGLQCV